MSFLPDVIAPCETCGGLRFEPATLDVRYHGLSIGDVLQLTAEDAADAFRRRTRRSRARSRRSSISASVTSQLGQGSNTLSGGEAQRLKLAAELTAGVAHEPTVYVLDEPTTGLHLADVRKLVSVLERLVDRGDTLVVIEHHPDVIAAADWVVELGPEGGAGGGRSSSKASRHALARRRPRRDVLRGGMSGLEADLQPLHLRDRDAVLVRLALGLRGADLDGLRRASRSSTRTWRSRRRRRGVAQHTSPLAQLALLEQLSEMPLLQLPGLTHDEPCCVMQHSCAQRVARCCCRTRWSWAEAEEAGQRRTGEAAAADRVDAAAAEEAGRRRTAEEEEEERLGVEVGRRNGTRRSPADGTGPPSKSGGGSGPPSQFGGGTGPPSGLTDVSVDHVLRGAVDADRVSDGPTTASRPRRAREQGSAPYPWREG